jgi:hypothetical protein
VEIALQYSYKAFEAAEFSAPCKVLGCAAPLKGKMKLICETF